MKTKIIIYSLFVFALVVAFSFFINVGYIYLKGGEITKVFSEWLNKSLRITDILPKVALSILLGYYWVKQHKQNQ